MTVTSSTSGSLHHHLTSSPTASSSTAFSRKLFHLNKKKPLSSSGSLSPSPSSSSNKRKWNISTIIRCMYWAIFLLLVLTTFLRTTVISNSLLLGSDSDPTGSGVPHHDIADDRPDVHRTFHQRIRGSVGGSRAFPADGIPTAGRRVLPGLHNPPSPLFESSRGTAAQGRNIAAAERMGGTVRTNQRSGPLLQPTTLGRATTPDGRHHNRNNNDDDDSNGVGRNPPRRVAVPNPETAIDWWAVLNKFDGPTRGHSSAKKQYYDGSSSRPPSDFVKKLCRLEEDLMSIANSTSAAAGGGQLHKHHITNSTGKVLGSMPSSTSSSASTRPQLAKPPSDQPIDFRAPILSPPRVMVQSQGNQDNSSDSNHRGSNMVVLVLSHQGSFINRQAIRETWANRNSTGSGSNGIHSQVLFVVAQSNCREFERDLEDGLILDANVDDGDDTEEEPDVGSAEEDRNGRDRRRGKSAMANTTEATTARSSLSSSSSSSSSSPLTCDEIDHNFLRLEQELYHDLLEIPMKEDYRRLPEKVLQAYHWVVNNLPHVEWIVKADDDMMVRVDSLERYLRKYNPHIPMVIGHIVYHSRVAHEGKWAEMDYPEEYYPFWPKGSAGHVVSRAAAKYLTDMSESLHRYQGEDVSIGIWLDGARKNGTLQDVTYIHANRMFTSGGKDHCERHKYMIIGHDFHPDELLACHNRFHSVFPEVAWLDDPSEFEELIRQDESPDYWPGAQQRGMGWEPSIGYSKNDNKNNIKDNNKDELVVKSGSSFGYRGKVAVFEGSMQ